MQAGLLDDLAGLLPGRVSTSADDLAAHASDYWPRAVMARRADDGEGGVRPGAVVWPTSTEEVARVLAWCDAARMPVVPFGAGTGVCGGANAVAGAVTLDLSRMAAVGELDDVSGTVQVQPGVLAQALEDHVAARGWTLGHFPSSIGCSTVGGLLAIRSAGQASSHYGKLEDMVLALEVVLADGTVVATRPVPSTSSGPPLTRLFLGGEGTTGVITSATLQVHPRPEVAIDRGVLFPDLATGLDALRAVIRAGLTPTVARLYDEADTQSSFPGLTTSGCVLVVAAEGSRRVAEFVADAVLRVVTEAGGTDLGAAPGEQWRAHRYALAEWYVEHLRSGGTFGPGTLLDTMEVAHVWSGLPRLYDAVRAALTEHADAVLAHVSHIYPSGASIYFTFSGSAPDEASALARYDAAWEAGQRAALAAGGTISHHHGIGLLRAPWLADDLGPGGMELLRRIKRALDPNGILNPGKLGLGLAPGVDDRQPA